MKSRRRNKVFGAVFLFVMVAIVVVIVLRLNLPQADDPPVSEGLSKVVISLNDTTLSEIYENGKEKIYSGNNLEIIADETVLEFADVEIKGRGNATWLQPKKPLQFKLSQKVDLLGLGKHRKWILLANSMDYTNLRTDTTFYIEKMVGEKFAYQGKFVELYVDDSYEGLYYLTRGIGIGKNAVDLRDPLGVLVELDNIYGEMEDPYFVTSNGERLTIKDTVVDDNAEVAMVDFMESFNALEAAIKAQDYRKITELIDVESFAQYYLISELTANPDAYFTSQYFYKDGPEDKIHAGPAWDFDVSLNNYRVRGEFAPDGGLTNLGDNGYWEVDEQYLQWSRLYNRLMNFPEFREEVNKVFQERLSGRNQELLKHVFRQAAKIYAAAMRDGERWGKEGYVGDVKRLLEWLDARYDYFEMEYGTKKHKNYPFYDINVIET